MNRLGKNIKGITLISLIVTIVVLIILTSVAIYLSIGNNGIFVRSKEARELANKQTATEKINLKITTAQMNKYAEEQKMPTLKELSEVLRDDNEIQYVTETSKVASAEYDVSSENPSSIYTKLNEYPYEFEINGQLQLASVDGVKIANNQSNSIDYSNNDNIVVFTETVTVNSKSWGEDVTGPQISSGTWLIYIRAYANTDGWFGSGLGSNCCPSSYEDSSWKGDVLTSGFYSGENTNLIARIYNDSASKKEYTLTIKALKLSNTHQ